LTASRIAWLRPDDPPELFPDVASALAEPDGLLAAGGDLSETRLLAAYRQGIFPWYDAGQPILWWSPDPRCVLRPAALKVSRRLRQYVRRSTCELRFNHAFGAVIRACAGRRRSVQGTWITPEMTYAYEQLHAGGWAHSIEVWDRGELVGGLYGLCIGRVFFGESMFSAVANASKFAMLGLVVHMLDSGLALLDCQVVSAHLVTLGASYMPRSEFCALLDELCDPPVRCREWPRQAVPVTDILERWLATALH
jgi:leucyl/phenylalanyl-tRNA--protein transferase